MLEMTIDAIIEQSQPTVKEYKHLSDYDHADKIIDAACALFGVEKKDILGASRARPLPDIRKVIYHLIREQTGMSSLMIERYLNRVHAFDFHAQKAMDNAQRFNPQLFDLYTQLKSII